MKTTLKLVKTKDNSYTLENLHFRETYHSLEGAFSESKHIYINKGVRQISETKKNFTIFEFGFGLGINAFLTLIEAINNRLKINYITIEKYPVPQDIIKDYDLPDEYKNFKDLFFRLHLSDWNTSVKINDFFTLRKIQADFLDFEFNFSFDLCFYDAFSYEKQPELWSYEIFSKIYNHLKINGLLVTYASKGIIKENLRKAGFKVKRFKAIGKKWHNLQAFKILE